MEWHAKALRAWQLAILRFAVTLDSADRLAAMAIANEIDRLAPQSAVLAAIVYLLAVSQPPQGAGFWQFGVIQSVVTGAVAGRD